jgi:hypothetical protein
MNEDVKSRRNMWSDSHSRPDPDLRPSRVPRRPPLRRGTYVAPIVS